MNYWLFKAEQTDGLTGRSQRAVDVWFDHGLGFSGNTRKEYGEPLGKMQVGDRVLMHENGTGVVGIGTVAEPWNGRGYKSKLIYVEQAFPEYRIRIDWHHDLRRTPFDLGWASPRFLCSLKKPNLVARAEEAIRLAEQDYALPPTADEADNYIPTDEDEREVVRQQIRQRRGQQRFRRKLVERYGRRCQVSSSAPACQWRAARPQRIAVCVR